MGLLKKILAGFTAMCIGGLSVQNNTEVIFSLESGTNKLGGEAADNATARNYQLGIHTPDEIRDYYEKHPWTYSETLFTVQPSLTAPYNPGEISEESLQNALNCLNFIRYVAGLPADIVIKDEYCKKVQTGQLINAVNNYMSHNPIKPSDMADELFQIGAEGNGKSNLWLSCDDLPQSLAVYMCDPGTDNINKVGHRRWILNPSMQYTGFGYANGYTGTYAHDKSRTADFEGDYIAWPAANMPYELYNGFDYNNHYYTFSVTLGPEYDEPVLSAVKVDMTSKKTGEVFHFDADSSPEKNGLSFNVDTSYNGIPNCIVFDPGKKLFDKDDVISVSISGITKKGVESKIDYNVSFFTLFDEATNNNCLELHTVDEIRSYYELHPWTNSETVFTKVPSVSITYDPGEISKESMQNALNCLNFIRYVAGIPADVMLKDDYCQKEQIGQLINAVNDSISYDPVTPTNMSEEMYKLGVEAINNSIHRSYCQTLSQSLVSLIRDSGNSNKSKLGHRRWILNPNMQYTGFGNVGVYSGVYAFDKSRSTNFTGDYIAWPAPNMPYELYNDSHESDHSYTFSVILGPEYDKADLASVKVDMTSKKTGESFHFDATPSTIANRFAFNVNTDYYGIPNCIIFDPGDRLFDVDDELAIKVSGITKNNRETEINYNVSFFKLYETIMGDLNSDGDLNIQDLLMFSKIMFNDLEGLSYDDQAIDLNEDGKLNIVDFCLLKELLLGA